MRLRGYLLVLAAAAQWGLIGPVAKVAFAAGMPPLTLAFWRVCLGWLLFACLAVRRREATVRPADLPMLLAFGVSGIAGLFGSLALAVDAGGAALAAVLLYTAPAWVALLARLFFREPMGPGKLTAVALTMLGVAGVSFGQGGTGAAAIGAPAILYGLLSGLTYALYYIFGKHFLTRYTTTTIFLYAMPAGALVLAPFVAYQSYPWQAWLAVGVMALVCTFGAYLAYYAGLKHLEATRAAVVATLEPVVAAVLAYVMWDETFGPLGYCGSALILAGVLLAMFEGERLSRAASGLLGRKKAARETRS